MKIKVPKAQKTTPVALPRSRKSKAKVKKVMHEFKKGTLKIGSKKGPKVGSRRQAVAIALSEARKVTRNKAKPDKAKK